MRRRHSEGYVEACAQLYRDLAKQIHARLEWRGEVLDKESIALLGDQGMHLPVIMKNGRLHKNTRS
jgi:hypothetical protein